MSSVIPAELPVDAATRAQLRTGERTLESARRRALGHRAKRRLTSPVATVAALVIAVLWTLPTLGLLITSVRPPKEILLNGWWTILQNPGLTIQNYVDVLGAGNSQLTLGEAFFNSVAITVPATVFPITIAVLAAYAFAWIDFRGKNVLFIGIFALQIIPHQMALVPLLSLFSKGFSIGGLQLFAGFDANGGYSQVWIAHTIFALPLAIFLLHNFISDIPAELIEAARVDGAGHGQIFFRIVLPLSTPAIASFAIFQFLWVWNDLLTALVFASGPTAPMTKLLAELTGTDGETWYLLTAGAFVSMIVPLVVFFSLQRYFVRGLLAGSTKG